MKPAGNIKQLIKNARIKINPEVKKAALKELISELDTSERVPLAATQPNIWRIIMKSRITKFSAAAVIIVAVMIGINQFDGSIEVTSTAFAQMTEDMKKMPWLHGVIEGEYEGKSDRLEAWISFESQVHVSRKSSGQIIYNDIGNHLSQLYDPRSETITMSHISGDEGMDQAGSVWGFWEMMTKQFIEADAEVSQEIYEGKEIKVYKISSSPFGTPMEIKITVDAQRNLPVLLNQKAYGPNGDLTIEANAYFDYPEDGPADIYEMGVPRSAKVVDNLPAENISEILEAYRAHRESAPSSYIAIVTDRWFDKKFDTFLTYGASVIYRDGKIQRVDDFRLPQVEQKDWREVFLEFEKEMGGTFESQLSWWQQNGQLSAVNLYDGKFQYQLKLENETWIAEPKKYLPFGDYRGDDDLADFGWSVHFVLPWSGDEPFNIIENEYSINNNLICLESVSQGRIVTDDKQTTWAIAPKRVLCYLNPERDYICQRFERHELFDASWQEDKTWFDRIEQNKFKKQWADNKIREIVEFGQTEDGLWYPQAIETWDPTDADNGERRIKRIWLRTDLEFPEGIFGPENLPR